MTPALHRVVCIVGATASGKTELAERCALAWGSEVISVDAMQVYRGMDIGTAKQPVEQRRVPLRMVDVADPTQDYSVALFQRAARAWVDGLCADGRMPVLCGGTGLYLDATIDEMSFPEGERGDERRATREAMAAEQGAEALYELLRSRDEASAALIHPHSLRRVIRALELLDQGKSYAQHHEGLKRRAPHYDARIWAIAWPRETLYARIDARVDRMVADGLLDEVRGLRDLGLKADSTAGQAIGYAEMLQVLEGSCALQDAIERTKTRTRRYAKRQLSWLRRDGRTRWLEPGAYGSWDEFCAHALRTMEQDLAKAEGESDVRS